MNADVFLQPLTQNRFPSAGGVPTGGVGFDGTAKGGEDDFNREFTRMDANFFPQPAFI